MRPFEYVVAETAGDAARLAAERDDAKFVAGGTNLVDLMKLGVVSPPLLIDLRRALDTGIERLPDGGVRIGAGATNSAVAAVPAIRESYPAVAQALLSGASQQLRNRATAGGNLLQRTRCLYFQDVAKPCNKRNPGSGCSAAGGEHRNHAILGTYDVCVATHPSDFAVALAAFDAAVRVTGASGERVVPLAELYRLPVGRADVDTVLGRDEVITAIELPAPPAGARSLYRKVGDRASFSFALVSAAVVVAEQSSEVRVALGGVAPRPWRLGRLEEALRGRGYDEATARAAIDAELALARPLPKNGFKLELTRRLVLGLLRELAA